MIWTRDRPRMPLKSCKPDVNKQIAHPNHPYNWSSQGAGMLRNIFLSLTLIAAAPLLAQSTDPIVHTTADLQQREAKLLETANASPSGMAVGRLEDYGNDLTLLVVRVHTGEAERHQFFA